MRKYYLFLNFILVLCCCEVQAQSFIYANHAGSVGNDIAHGVCTDASGNVYVAGEYHDSITFGTTVLHSSAISGFVVKYNSSGNVVWAKRINGTGSTYAAEIRCDNSGNIYIAGTYYSATTYDTVTTATINSNAGSTDIFLAKINATTGVLSWMKSMGSSTGDDAVNGIAVDANNNVYLVGKYSGTSNFGNNISITSVPYPTGGTTIDCFTAKFNSSGVAQWAESGGGIGTDTGYGIAVDVAGNSYITGGFLNTVTFNGATLTSAGSVDIFVASYDPSGNLQLLFSASSTDYESGYGIALDGAGYFYITGLHDGHTVFDTITAVPNGSYDMFLAKYNLSGQVQWVQSTLSTQWESGNAVVVDAKGNPYVTGDVYHGGTSMFSEVNIVSAGYYDSFIVKYNKYGEFQWATRGGSINYDEPSDMAVADSGKIYIAGYYSAAATFGNFNFNTAGGDDMFLLKMRTDLTTNPATVVTYCAGQPINVTFKSYIQMAPDNIYTAQLSDAIGKFANAINIGTLASASSTGVITGVLPDNLTDGTGYRVRIISSDSARTGDDNGNNITIHALPTAILTSPGISICGNDSIALTVSTTAGSTYQWYKNNVLISGAGINKYYAKTTAAYFSVVTNSSGCSRTSNTISITQTFNVPATPGTITGAGRPCPGDTITYSIVPVAYAIKYSWTLPAGAAFGSVDTTTFSVKVIYSSSFVSGTLSVKASNACGTSAAKTKSINRNIPGTPSVISGSAFGVCSGTTNIYTINSVNYATTYLWTVPSGIIINSGQGTTAVSLTFPATFTSATISVKAGNSCGFGTARTLVIKSIPGIPVSITGPATACAHQTGVTYFTAPVTSATAYTWTVPSGASITSGQGTDTIVMKFGTAGGNVKVKAVNGCGASSNKTFAVIINCREDDAEINNPTNVSVYPNPSNTNFSIDAHFATEGNYNLTVRDILGRVIEIYTNINYQQSFNFGKTLHTGIYFVEVSKGDEHQVLRIVKSDY